MPQDQDGQGSGGSGDIEALLEGVDSANSSIPGPLVKVGELPNGYRLFRQENGVGGYVYFSDEIDGIVRVWDTTLVDSSTILAAMADEAKLRYDAARSKNRISITHKSPA